MDKEIFSIKNTMQYYAAVINNEIFATTWVGLESNIISKGEQESDDLSYL